MIGKIKQLYHRTSVAAYPVLCGLKAVSLYDLIENKDSLEISVEDWKKDLRAGSPWNLLSLVSIVRAIEPKVVVEIGTGLGRSTLQIAKNISKDSKVYTFDIADHPDVGHIFRGKPEEKKIEKVLADSKTYDFSQLKGKVDLVLVDGGHDYESVKNDTAIAFDILSPGGVIIWDDLSPSWPGVGKALRECPQAKNIKRIAGTSYAVYSR